MPEGENRLAPYFEAYESSELFNRDPWQEILRSKYKSVEIHSGATVGWDFVRSRGLFGSFCNFGPIYSGSIWALWDPFYGDVVLLLVFLFFLLLRGILLVCVFPDIFFIWGVLASGDIYFLMRLPKNIVTYVARDYSAPWWVGIPHFQCLCLMTYQKAIRRTTTLILAGVHVS